MSHSPTTVISLNMICVWKEGASADASQPYLPELAATTDVSSTWLALDLVCCKCKSHGNYVWWPLPGQQQPRTHVNVHAGHFEHFLGRILLQRVPVELSAPLVPLYRVEDVSLHVIVARQQHILTCPHCCGDAHLVDLNGPDSFWN